MQQELVCKDHNYDEQIITPLQLYERASQANSSVNFAYCTIGTIEQYQRLSLRIDFRKVKLYQEHEVFIPVSNDTLETKRYSLSSIYKKDMDTQIELVSGYVRCVHNNR